MKAMLAVVVSVLGACGPTPCPKVSLADSAQVFPTGDSVMLMYKQDTIPKPFAPCVVLYTTRKDTIPKP